jgi:hypothetical protein
MVLKKYFMKKILLAVLVMVLGQAIKAQMPAQLVAERIATRMKDSLTLSTSQRAQLYSISLNIENQVKNVFRLYNGTDSLPVKLKLIEYTRDSLYRPILTDEQFNLYKMKKMSLVF